MIDFDTATVFGWARATSLDKDGSWPDLVEQNLFLNLDLVFPTIAKIVSVVDDVKSVSVDIAESTSELAEVLYIGVVFESIAEASSTSSFLS